MTRHHEAARELEVTFGVMWKNKNVNQEDVRKQTGVLCEKYSGDMTRHPVEEIEHLKAIHAANLGQTPLSPLQPLNSLHELKLDTLFPNISIVLRIFCTLPVTVAQTECSFSALATVKKNVLRSSVCQDRLMS